MKKNVWVFLFTFLGIYVQAQNIPNPASYLGYQIGDRFTPHYKIVQYMETLAKADPVQTKLLQYGSTYGGRPLILMIISSQDNMTNLENIRTNNIKLAGMNGGNGTINGKAVVWLSYNVHGNEAGSSEAAMLTAYALLSNPAFADYLKNTVIIIDPCLNPDGRDRYVNWYNSVVGIAGFNPNPQSREHEEPWPGGRTNYYNFDLNRDWAWQTQTETQSRIAVYHKWMPEVHVDFHEQGYNDPYYFAPAAEPFHEVITPWQRNFQTQIGRNNARYFDKNGWLYFTKERFDLFYPSYGDTWPTYNGGIGMTYEQAGHARAGLGVITKDGDTLTLKDRAVHHYTTSIATIEICAKNAVELQQHFKQYFENSITNGIGDYKSFVLKENKNKQKLAAISLLLQKNNIEYGYATPGAARGYNYFTGKEENFMLEKDDIIINTTQSSGALAKVLFEPTSKLKDSVTYDITAWSVPYVYGAQAYAIKERLNLNPAKDEAKTNSGLIRNTNSYGFIKRWEAPNDAYFLAACMKKGIKVRMAEKGFVINGKSYAPGTLIFIKTTNKSIENFNDTIVALANEFNANIETVETGFVDKGSDFGSPDVKLLSAPKVAMLTGEDVNSQAAGEIWHFFEQQLKYPISLVNANNAGHITWDKFDVIILPNGFYGALLDKDGELKKYVQNGGKLIVMEDAVNQLAKADWGLHIKFEKDEPDDAKVATNYDRLKQFANAERDELAYSNFGSIFKVEMDSTHPLGFGYPSYYFTLKCNDLIYEFMKDGWNVGVIKKGNKMAGFTGAKTKEKLKDGVLFGEMPIGNGSVVFFADDVLFRSFWENGKLMFANAVLLVNQGK